MPTFLRRLRARIKYWNNAEELKKELDAHRAMAEASIAADGTSARESRWKAARLLGNTTIAREDSRAMWIPLYLQQLNQDARYAVRGMRRTPGFTAAALLMLTLGIGVVAGGYTFVNGMFFQGWDVPDNGRVFSVHARRAVEPATGSIFDGFSLSGYSSVAAASRAADYVAIKIAYSRIRKEGDARGVFTPGIIASTNIIDVLRIPLALGTGQLTFAPGDSPSAVISYRTWERVFDKDPLIIGRAAWINDKPVTITGVTQEAFEGLGPSRLDIVVGFPAALILESHIEADLVTKDECCVSLAGRLRGDQTIGSATEELAVLTAQFRSAANRPALTVELGATTPMSGLSKSPKGKSLAFLLAMIAAGLLLVLLLTCANVGNLYLARSLRRRREIAVRLSLGASRSRVVRQLVTEGLVLASVAGAGAFLVTAGVPILMQQIEDNFTASMLPSDWRVALFTALAVVITSLAVALTPALHVTRIARHGANPLLARGTGRIRGVILGTQIAVATLLVVSAALISRGILHAAFVPSDFAIDSSLIAMIETPENYPAEKVKAARNAIALGAAEPSGPGLIHVRPRSGKIGIEESYISLPGSDAMHRAQLVPVSPNAVGILGLNLVAGAWPRPGANHEAVVNETMVKRVWPDGDAIGSSLLADYNGQRYTVVGIARDAHLSQLGDVEPTLLVASTEAMWMPALVTRDNAESRARVRSLVRAADPALVVTLTPMRSLMQKSLETAAIGAATAGSLGAVALVLAVIGVFGVFSYMVEERRREIGIRLALGATKAQIRRALFSAGRAAVFGGLASGLLASTIAGMLLRRFLFGLSPADPVSYGAVAIILVGAAMLATFAPIRRAVRVNPAVTLRAD